MALSINPETRVITVPQADLVLVSGTFYRLDTNQFRIDVLNLLDDERFIWLPNAFSHNGEVTVAGVTYSRTLEYINSFSVEFENGQYSVELVGSNNNIFDVQNGILVQNEVQIIPTNSAGLQTVVSGSGVTQQDKDDIVAQMFAHLVEGGESFTATLRLIRAMAAGTIVEQADGSYVIKSLDGLTDRIEGESAANGGRNVSGTDAT